MDLLSIKKSALERHIPIIMDDTLEVITKILKEKKPENLLEIGSAVGYSAICFSEFVHKIDTIELDIEKAQEAINNVKALGLENKITVINGDALDVLPTLMDKANKYDIIFIDASKSKYPKFLEYSLQLLSPNGVIIADNVLYKGYVLSNYNKHKQRTAVRHLREFLQMCKDNEKLEMELLEVGDGLAIITPKN